MKVIRITPHGYRYGVVDAREIACKAARDPHLPLPIYVVGLIMHNRFAVAQVRALVKQQERKSIYA